MAQHSHEFVETYTGLVGYGLDRTTDQATLQVYLQKFSDDECMARLLPRMSQEQMDALFHTMSDLLRQHFNEDEYHALFLKDHEHSN
ncbi:Cytoplasmic protein [Desulfarculales bacterium]